MIDTILGWLPAIAALLSPVEWKALLILFVAIIAATQTIKVVWRILPIPGGGDHTSINLIAAVIAFPLAFAIWPPGFTSWVVIAIIAGPLSVFLFKLAFGLLRMFLPSVAATVNFDRRKDVHPLPPTGVEERRKSRVG